MKIVATLYAGEVKHSYIHKQVVLLNSRLKVIKL